MSPAVAVVPIEVSPKREVFVLCTWVCDITHKHIDVLFVFLHPLWIEVPDRRSGKNMIAIMKVVVIVIGVAKVGPCIASHVGC